MQVFLDGAHGQTGDDLLLQCDEDQEGRQTEDNNAGEHRRPVDGVFLRYLQIVEAHW